MRTNEEIQAEIKWLKENKPKISRYTLFNDDNHAAIDAQIAVLEDGLGEDDVFDLAENEGWNDHVRDNAMDAAMWIDGDDELKPSHEDNWGSIVK